MHHLLTILAALCLLSAPAAAQTLKSLMFNSTNGQVVANTGTNSLTFANPVTFSNSTLIQSLSVELNMGGVGGNDLVLYSAISFDDLYGNDIESATRTNLSLGLPALTNTSNVTMMRALAGSTNTNEPYSGTIQYADHPEGDVYLMTVSNGLILKTELVP